MKPSKTLLVAILLLSTAIIAFALPKPIYKSLNILPTLEIPSSINGLRSYDISGQFDVNDERYKFVGDIFATMYENYTGEKLVLIVLDAGNFHNPKVCMGASGYSSKELPDVEFITSYNRINAHNIYFEKGNEGNLIIYWICINKKIVDWNSQKLIQLWHSIFNKEKAGLMIRLDVPTTKDNIQNSINFAREFITNLSKSLPREKAKYIFGQ